MPNQLVNGDFETGSASNGWHSTGAGSTTAQSSVVHSGNFAAQLTMTLPPGDGGAQGGIASSQGELRGNPGTINCVEAWLRGNALSGPVTLSFHYWPDNGGQRDLSPIDPINLPDGEWLYVRSSTVPDGGVPGTVSIRVDTPVITGSEILYVDDVGGWQGDGGC